MGRDRITMLECGEIYVILRGEKDCIEKIKAKIASITEYEEVIAMDWRWNHRSECLKKIK